MLEGSGLGIVVSRAEGSAVATGGDSHIALRSRVRVGVGGGGGEIILVVVVMVAMGWRRVMSPIVRR